MTEQTTRPADASAGQTPPPAARADTPEQRRIDRLVIGLLLVSAFVVILNETVMGVALPALDEDLGISVATGQWLTTAFMLVMAVVIPITGYLLQRFPIRRVFIAAMTLFSIGTLIAFLAPGFGVLLLGRVVQATGTAIMMPLLFTTVLNIVPPERRGRVMGNISIVISVAPAIGPTVSGLILSTFEWRWIFGMVLPIAILGLVLGAILMRNVTETRESRIDVVSVVLSVFAFGGLVYGFSSMGEGAEAAVLPPMLVVAVGVVALALFVWRQLSLQRRDRALLDLRVFTNRNFTIPIALVAVSFVALFGTIILLPVYMQNVLELSTLESGLALLPGGLLMGVLAPIVGRLFDKVGPRPLLIPGAAVVSLTLWAMTMLLDESSPVALIIALHVTLSLGLAFMFTPLFTGALGSVEPRMYSHGSAVLGTVQQLAGAVGTATFIGVMSATAAAAGAEGVGAIAAESDGISAAFLVGAMLSIAAFVAAFFVRRPANAVPAGAGAH